MSERNENRPGYKKTPVGWIPENWSAYQIGQGCHIKHGYAFSGHLVDQQNTDAAIVICIGNYSYSGGFRFGSTPLKRITGTYPSEYVLQTGNIVLAMTCQTPGGEILGLPGIVPDDGRIYLHNQRLGLLEIEKADHFYSDFLYYVFLSFGFNKFLYERATGTKVKHTSPETIESYRLPTPSLPEQKKIAKILSTWDRAIDQTRRLIDAKKRRKKALMQQLLTGRMRLPGFAKSHGREFYRFFDLPEDWDCPRMREIAHECSERNGKNKDIPVLACSKYRGFVKSSEYFGKQVFSADTSNYKVIRRDWFGFPSNHIEEGSIGLLMTYDVGLLSPIYVVFRCTDDVVPDFLYAVFKTVTFRHIFRISTNASVDRRGSLRWREFSLIQVPLPSKKEQWAIADVLRTADTEIVKLEAKLQALEKQKRGLMQKLLTGQVRVKT